MTRRPTPSGRRWGAMALVFAVSVVSACAASAPSPNVPSDSGPEPVGTPTPTPIPTPTGPVAGSAGCGKDSPAGFEDGKKTTVAGRSRSFALSVPDGYDKNRAYPLVFGFHGDGGTGAGLRRSMKLESVTGGGAIFVYPDGLGKTWDLETAPDQNQDAGLFDALVSTLSADYCIDAKRVFATGYSRGGYFANQLGCWRGGALRGVASSGSGGPFGKQYDDTGHLVCPQRGMATIIFHGQNDSPGEGQKSLDHWAWANGCPDKNKQTDTPPSPCKQVSGCASDKPVVWCLIPGMGHQIWSESDAATWAFFSKL